MEVSAAFIGLAKQVPLLVLPFQAAAVNPRTNPHGIPTGRDHPHPSSHPGPQLPAHQAKPLQQPYYHTLRLPQVRAASAGSEGNLSPDSTLHDSFIPHTWNEHLFAQITLVLMFDSTISDENF